MAKAVSVTLENSEGLKGVLAFWESVVGRFNAVFLKFDLWGKRSGEVGGGVVNGAGSFRGKGPKWQWKKVIGYGLMVVVIVGLAIGIGRVWQGFGKSGSVTNETAVLGAKATEAVGREFSFPLRDAKGVEVGRLKFLVDKAELRDEILVKGQKAKAVEGRTFLLLTLKISNEFERRIEIDTRDYVRLSVNGNKDEWLAPDFHNDPVEVQAISIKYTRVGFPINGTDTNLVLRIGEIKGEKTEISLTIK